MITTEAALFVGSGTSLLVGARARLTTCSCGQELAGDADGVQRHCPRCGCCLS